MIDFASLVNDAVGLNYYDKYGKHNYITVYLVLTVVPDSKTVTHYVIRTFLSPLFINYIFILLCEFANLRSESQFS